MREHTRTTTTYDYERGQRLRKEREAVLGKMRSIVAQAKAASRDLDGFEQQAMTAAQARIKELDAELQDQGRALAKSNLSLGTAEHASDSPDVVRYLSLRTPGLKADLAARPAPSWEHRG